MVAMVHLQAELYADGVGDHAFLLRLAELALERNPRSHSSGGAPPSDVIRTLNLNTRGLAFARKVRAQLVTVVETRVWPVYVREKGPTQKEAASTRHRTDDGADGDMRERRDHRDAHREHRDSRREDRGGGKDRERDRRGERDRCPDLRFRCRPLPYS